MTNYTFPTLGQVIRFAFDVCGVLPRKRGECDGLTEQDRKRIQKQLERLSNEEGKLVENAGAAIRELAFIITGTVSSTKVVLAMGEVLMDLFEVYNQVIRSDGTYLSERDSIRWFCSAYAIPRLVISVRRHLLRFNVASSGLVAPSEVDWYLPTVTGEGVTWPLAKAMHWAYGICDTNQTHFHYPGKNARTSCVEQTQNLENAGEWCRGVTIPTWNSLHWNVSRSFERLASVEDPKYRRDIPETLRENILSVLFFARLSTSVCKALTEAYGTMYLGELVTKYRQHDAWLEPDLAVLRQEVECYERESAGSSVTGDRAWWELSERYWSAFADRMSYCAREMEYLLMQGDGISLPEETLTALIAKYGEYPVRGVLDNHATSRLSRVPPGFAQAVCVGLELKSNPDCSDHDVDLYAATLQRDALDEQLAWMVTWLRAIILYRREDFRTAFDNAELAFERAKYSAGMNQYALVNLYIELAAKTGKWKNFKKGIEWANFIGLSIRLLRSMEPSEENLRGVFTLMKKVQYRH